MELAKLKDALEAAVFMGLYTASRVTPLALALVHRSCPVTAEVYSATGGDYAHFDEIRGAGTVPNEVDGEALVWGLQSFAPRLLPLVR